MATTRTLEARRAAGMAGAGLAEFDVMVVLGSGLGAFAESLGGAHAVPVASPHVPGAVMLWMDTQLWPARSMPGWPFARLAALRFSARAPSHGPASAGS